MALLDLPRWFQKWILRMILNKPAMFLAMRYYNVKNYFKERKENKEKAKESREERVRTKRSSGKTSRRRT